VYNICVIDMNNQYYIDENRLISHICSNNESLYWIYIRSLQFFHSMRNRVHKKGQLTAIQKVECVSTFIRDFKSGLRRKWKILENFARRVRVLCIEISIFTTRGAPFSQRNSEFITCVRMPIKQRLSCELQHHAREDSLQWCAHPIVTHDSWVDRI